MDSAIRTEISSSALQIELAVSDAWLRERHFVRPGDIAEPLAKIGWACALAHGTAEYSERAKLLPMITLDQWEPRIARVHYGSPFFTTLDLPGPLLTDVAGMSLLIYALKRIWKLPQEFRIHDEKMQARQRKAEQEAIEAEIAREKALRKYEELLAQLHSEEQKPSFRRPSPRADRRQVNRQKDVRAKLRMELEDNFKQIDKRARWPEGTISAVEEKRSGAWRWEGKSALWLLDDNAE